PRRADDLVHALALHLQRDQKRADLRRGGSAGHDVAHDRFHVRFGEVAAVGNNGNGGLDFQKLNRRTSPAPTRTVSRTRTQTRMRLIPNIRHNDSDPSGSGSGPVSAPIPLQPPGSSSADVFLPESESIPGGTARLRAGARDDVRP